MLFSALLSNTSSHRFPPRIVSGWAANYFHRKIVPLILRLCSRLCIFQSTVSSALRFSFFSSYQPHRIVYEGFFLQEVLARDHAPQCSSSWNCFWLRTILEKNLRLFHFALELPHSRTSRTWKYLLHRACYVHRSELQHTSHLIRSP